MPLLAGDADDLVFSFRCWILYVEASIDSVQRVFKACNRCWHAEEWTRDGVDNRAGRKGAGASRIGKGVDQTHLRLHAGRLGTEPGEPLASPRHGGGESQSRVAACYPGAVS